MAEVLSKPVFEADSREQHACKSIWGILEGSLTAQSTNEESSRQLLDLALDYQYSRDSIFFFTSIFWFTAFYITKQLSHISTQQDRLVGLIMTLRCSAPPNRHSHPREALGLVWSRLGRRYAWHLVALHGRRSTCPSLCNTGLFQQSLFGSTYRPYLRAGMDEFERLPREAAHSFRGPRWNCFTLGQWPRRTTFQTCMVRYASVEGRIRGSPQPKPRREDTACSCLLDTPRRPVVEGHGVRGVHPSEKQKARYPAYGG
jgi:hypothetical protein